MTLADTKSTHADTHAGTHASDDAAENALAAKIIFTILALLVAWGLSVFTWGVPGLYIPALAAVPVIYGVLILIAKGG